MTTRDRILDAISTWHLFYDYPPSFRDIQQFAQLSSPSVVLYQLRRLRDEGKVRWVPRVARSVRLVGAA